MTNKDKRPNTSRLVSTFDEPITGDSTFGGEPTIPGQYSTLVPEHEQISPYDSELSELMDPSFDAEYADNTQTDLAPMAARVIEQEAEVQIESLLLSIVSVIDDMDSLLQAARDKDSKLVSDIEMTHARLLDTVAEYHVQPIVADGQPVDPTVHEVVREIVIDDSQRAGKVVEVKRVGYLRQGRALRRARVVVGRNKT